MGDGTEGTDEAVTRPLRSEVEKLGAYLAVKFTADFLKLEAGKLSGSCHSRVDNPAEFLANDIASVQRSIAEFQEAVRIHEAMNK